MIPNITFIDYLCIEIIILIALITIRQGEGDIEIQHNRALLFHFEGSMPKSIP